MHSNINTEDCYDVWVACRIVYCIHIYVYATAQTRTNDIHNITFSYTSVSDPCKAFIISLSLKTHRVLGFLPDPKLMFSFYPQSSCSAPALLELEAAVRYMMPLNLQQDTILWLTCPHAWDQNNPQSLVRCLLTLWLL